MRDTVGRSWKLLVLVAAGLGVWSFFLPIHRYTRDGASDLHVSAYRVARGYERAVDIDPSYASLERWQQDRIVRDTNETIQYVTHGGTSYVPRTQSRSLVPYYFTSIAILVLVALFVFVTRTLGTFTALTSLVMGLAALGAVLRELVVDRRVADVAERASSSVGSAAAVLAFAGALALIAGVGGLLVPDPGGFRAKRGAPLPKARLVARR